MSNVPQIKLNNMKKNVGSVDKIVRIIIAVVFVALYFLGLTSGVLGLILIGLAAIFVLTSIVSFCPLYLPFGISTCKAKE